MRTLLEDLHVASGGGIAKSIYTWFFDVNFKAVKLYRYSHWLNDKFGFKIIPRLLNIRSRRRYGIDIDFGAEIGPGFHIVHGNGVVIGRWVHAGRNLTIYQGCTLGGNSGKSITYNGITIVQPYIGNNVKLFTSCIVIGPIVIGDDVEVGAGTIITHDVENNCVVYSKQKIHIIKKENSM